MFYLTVDGYCDISGDKESSDFIYEAVTTVSRVRLMWNDSLHFGFWSVVLTLALIFFFFFN